MSPQDWSDSLWLGQLLSWAASFGIIFGGVVPYVPQYLQIRRTENAEGFSTHVCLALLLANTLRILFWYCWCVIVFLKTYVTRFGRQFEWPLLIQSIVMNTCILALMELCVRVKQRHSLVPNKTRYFLDFDPKYFWEWTDFISYIECLAAFTVVAGILMYSFLDNTVFVEIVGFVAVFTEALLGVPQLLKNYRKKSTFGMSISMVLFWTIGDLFKTGYFVARSAPIQFWICGILQVSIDLFIVGQVIFYRSSVAYSKLSKGYDN